MRLVDDIVSMLDNRQQNTDSEFHDLFVKVTDVAQEQDIEIKLPRKPARQIHRENYSTTNPEAYYRQSIYISYIDNKLSQLRECFEIHNRICLRVQGFLPKFLSATCFDDVKEALDLYKTDLGEMSVVRGEITDVLN